VKDLKFNLSDESLLLLPEYEQRVQVLKALHYINAEQAVQLKAGSISAPEGHHRQRRRGAPFSAPCLPSAHAILSAPYQGRVACEISTCDEIVATELVFENALTELDPAEIVALLSCMVFQEKRCVEPKLTPTLQVEPLWPR
jgi:antiviral helicase SKI2